MPFEVSTGSTAIAYGASLKIGYRPNGSASAFTYVPTIPNYNDLPFTFEVTGAGEWEIQYLQICPSCSMPAYSSPQTAVVTVSA